MTTDTTKEGFDIRDHIDMHMVVDGDDTRGWVHTHGMEKFDKPELEIRGLPMFMMEAGARLLNQVADYMVTSGAEVKLGQKLELGRFTICQLQKLPPIKSTMNHFKEERWALVDVPAVPCSCCDKHDCDGSTH